MKDFNIPKEDLIARVKKAIEFLKFHNVKNAKIKFFDAVYGEIYKAASNKLDNLWACKTTQIEFTDNIEKFANDPTSFKLKDEKLARYLKFVDWYEEIGGRELKLDEIKNIYPNF